jgi:phosphopentomutase
MAQIKGTKNMTLAVGIETRKEFLAFCEQRGLSKHIMITKALQYFNSLPDYQKIEIYHGKDTMDGWWEMFKAQVLEAVAEKAPHQSDQATSSHAKAKQRGSGD